MEVWRYILNYNNYQISNLGRVKALEKKILYKDGRIRSYSEKILKLRKDRKGYYFVTLYNINSNLQLRIHRLVAEAFILNPENKPCVNHIDSNRLNNQVENLEWCTYKENTNHAIKVNRLYKPARKLTEEQVNEIKNIYWYGNYSQKDIAKVYKLKQAQISRIVNNKNWKELTI